MQTKAFLSQLDEQKVVAAISEAESKTSGEIRVYVSSKTVEDPVAAAQRYFMGLGMEKTKARNGVLIFFAPKSQNFAVIGDTGIHQKCGQLFWTDITRHMAESLQKEKFTEAVVDAVRTVGQTLAQYFPHEPDDTNELSNEVATD